MNMSKYDKMTIDEVEQEVNDLNNERLSLADEYERGNITKVYAERKYTSVSKKWGELYQYNEKRKAEQYDKFLSAL